MIEILDSVVGELAVKEHQQAARALLQQPLVLATGSQAEDFRLIRRHAKALQAWFVQYPGWNLQIEAEFARLRKWLSTPPDASHPAKDPYTGLAFTRRRYVLFCLALAALEQADRQTVLGDIAQRVVGMMHEDPTFRLNGLDFDLKTQDQRRDLVSIIRLLISLGAISRVDGDEQAFLQEKGDVLYSIHRPILASLLCVRKSPSTLQALPFDEQLHALIEEFRPDTEEGRNRQIRTLLIRRLLDEPIVYYDSLSEREKNYLMSQRHTLAKAITDITGLHAEMRREGIAMVDEEGTLSDVILPREGTEGHVTLLLAEFLTQQAREAPGTRVSLILLHQYTVGLLQTYGNHWKKEAREPGAEQWLVELALSQLSALKLIHRAPEGILPLPAVGRFALAPQTLPETVPSQGLSVARD